MRPTDLYHLPSPKRCMAWHTGLMSRTWMDIHAVCADHCMTNPVHAGHLFPRWIVCMRKGKLACSTAHVRVQINIDCTRLHAACAGCRLRQDPCQHPQYSMVNAVLRCHRTLAASMNLKLDPMGPGTQRQTLSRSCECPVSTKLAKLLETAASKLQAQEESCCKTES